MLLLIAYYFKHSNVHSFNELAYLSFCESKHSGLKPLFITQFVTSTSGYIILYNLYHKYNSTIYMHQIINTLRSMNYRSYHLSGSIDNTSN